MVELDKNKFKVAQNVISSRVEREPFFREKKGSPKCIYLIVGVIGAYRR